MDDLIDLLRNELQDWNCSWSIGSLSAIGEFHHDPGERTRIDDLTTLTRSTARGAIRITPRADMSAIAYEVASPLRYRWNHGVALCLPEPVAPSVQRTVLTELGPDREAIDHSNMDGILFDLGLAQPQIDFCIRSTDRQLIALLRSCLGKPTFSTPAADAILAAHPHRVVISKLGRIEVYQKIGGQETGGASPAGPHTHFPELLASRRTHSANIPVPVGLVPCACLYPPNPITTPLGEDKKFDASQFSSFQKYLERYGPAKYVETKASVWSAIRAGRMTITARLPQTRVERAAFRIALRQILHQSEQENDRSTSLHARAWLNCFDNDTRIKDNSDLGRCL